MINNKGSKKRYKRKNDKLRCISRQDNAFSSRLTN